MRSCGFDLTVQDISRETVPTVSFWVRDDSDGSLHIPMTMALTKVDVRELRTCRCSQCTAVAILTYALHDLGTEQECPMLPITLRELELWHEDTHRRGAHEAKPE